MSQPPLHSIQSLLTAGSPPPHWSWYSCVCHCWKETIWEQSANSQTNQPTNLAAIPVQHSSYHRLFVFPPVFQVAFCGPLKPSVIDKPRKVMGALLFLKLDHLCDVVCSGVAPTPSLATRMD